MVGRPRARADIPTASKPMGRLIFVAAKSVGTQMRGSKSPTSSSAVNSGQAWANTLAVLDEASAGPERHRVTGHYQPDEITPAWRSRRCWKELMGRIIDDVGSVNNVSGLVANPRGEEGSKSKRPARSSRTTNRHPSDENRNRRRAGLEGSTSRLTSPRKRGPIGDRRL